ncbi:aminopeptidase [Sandaracinobacter neustonicus]|uniref:Aminopeptidase n=1 Tax=Sandaracinobacter neustonicus TaxID=1715348 RepID=A0A501XTP8_9SPHN|nr:M1 family aminopeptidase [Sandaracinobacter neustonicus]TPE63946.1 aminopeptidase [Sandaracinobacter neustonicus]
MFKHIAGFELRYQLRNPVFWVVCVLFFLLTFAATTIEEVSIGSGGNVNVNSPYAILQTHLVLSIFFMFVTTAFVANVIVRDDESGFGPMVKSTRVSKFDYLLARFLGAFMAAAIAFLVVPFAIWLGSLMPWVDKETIGPNVLGQYAWAWAVIAVPNILLTSAIFFAVATLTRSMMYSYLGVVVFLVLYLVVTGIIGSKPELRELAAFVEPFGFGAIGNATRYWTAAERNSLMPPLVGPLLWNRLIWMGVALAALGFAYARFSFGDKGASKRALARQARREAKLAATPPQIVSPLPAARPDEAWWPRLAARTRFEMAQVFKSPAFIVLLLIGLFNAGGALWYANEIYGTPARPLTFALIELLIGTFALIPLIIAIYYAGELVWRDRDRKMHEIIDATSLPNWAYLVPKVIAVSAVLFATLLISVVASVIIQLIRGQTDLQLGQYLLWYILPLTVDMVILSVLAVFVQALSPNKYVGWAIMVVYIVATISLKTMGFEHPLYLYGETGRVRFSDMNGDNVGGATAWWLRLYWGAFALILAVLAHLLWRRGTAVSLKSRLQRMPARLKGAPGLLLLAGALIAGGTGAFIFHNMNVLNPYRTQDDNEARLAAIEKKYLKYEKLPQPAITDIKLDVDLHPAEKRADFRGRYALVNNRDVPISDLHIQLNNPDLKLLSLTIPGATLVSDDPELGYRIYRFARPLQPGETASLEFHTRLWQQGFRAQGDSTSIIPNGSFLNNSDFAPLIGMDRSGLLSDRVKRRKQGLPAELRPAKLEDMSATQRNYVGNAAWVSADITVTTDADQTPIAPGDKVSDVSKDDRRTARFVSKGPILSFFSVQSARYAEKTLDDNGVKLSVFYHPGHEANVETMLKAMKASLDYYRANFGPYQFDHARIIEFPGYATFAQAFAGTMPYSESIGFLADTSDPDAIDYPTYVTAHEVAHQYWAHQIISADMQGGTIWVETLAQYSALMVMKQLYGEDKIRRFLKYELDNYLRNRGGEAIEELPLNRVENQGYIHYRKGSLALYLLADRLGEDRVNAMLAEMLKKYRFTGPPYVRSTDLVDGFKSLARTPEERQLVEDLLEKITIFDLKAPTASTRKLPDGNWETTLNVSAAKAYADGKGKETPAPLADSIDVGLFKARPGQGAFSKADVILMERRPVRSGEQKIVIVTKEKPAFAGIDPYNKYVDRNSDDNVTAVTGG